MPPRRCAARLREEGFKDAETVEFEFSSGQDVRPQVAKAVVQAGYELIEMRPVGMSLEEIFLELTQDNSAGKKS